MLKGKNILIGISGGISAYKIPNLIRLLVKEQANVKVITTVNAKQFVSSRTLSILSGCPAVDDLFSTDHPDRVLHVELGLWADIFWIAPCTASQLSRMATGLSNNLLTTTYLSARCPVFIAPAMDLDMYKHPTSIKNIQILQSHGVHVEKAEKGFLASGLVGEGRMIEPKTILERTKVFFSTQHNSLSTLHSKRVLITAGPTQEAIDPVRYISNHSSGKMGYALAEYCANIGAYVTLVSGPTVLHVDNKNIEKINVVTAQEMLEACASRHAIQDVCIFAAAVADFSPVKSYEVKLKNNDLLKNIPLKKNQDIAKVLGQKKTNNQIHIGFALETNEEVKHAIQKLEEKNFDLIILNSLNSEGVGFGRDTHEVSIISPNKTIIDLPLQSKKDLSKVIIENHILPLVSC